MYFIENFQNLVGKTIAYIDMEGDINCVIGTTDGGIISFYIDSYNPPRVYKKQAAEYYLLNRQELVNEMIKAGMPIEESYLSMLKKHKERQEKEKLNRAKKIRQNEYEQYLKLKKKFKQN